MEVDSRREDTRDIDSVDGSIPTRGSILSSFRLAVHSFFFCALTLSSARNFSVFLR